MMNMFVATDTVQRSDQTLSHPDAVLRVLEALRKGQIPAPHRILLEGFAFLASKPEFRQKNCRVFRAFRSDQWQIDLHDSLNRLEQARQVTRHKGTYSLTSLGDTRLGPILADASAEQEAADIRHLAQRVIIGLDL